LATILLVHDDAHSFRVEALDALTGDQVEVGATARDGLLIARTVGTPLAVRSALAQSLPRLRASALGLPPFLPRVWSV
jgi:hypothetical protein